MTETQEFDVIILGGGPGGYLAAERLGHGGKKVLLVEESALGGTCLNVGCIPTKTLLNSAKHYIHAQEGAQFGVDATDVTFDWPRMQLWKDEVVKGLVSGVGMAEKKAGVTVLNARGTFEGPGKVSVDGTTYTAEHVILATGSVPAMPPIPGSADNPAVVDSTGILSLESVPSRLAVIGGGVIGVEFASLFSTLGSEVTVIEMAPEIVPFADTDMASTLRQAMDTVTFELGCTVESLNGPSVTYSKDGEKFTIEADVILMAVGRRPAVQGWGAENTSLEFSPRGIVVDDRMRTNLPNVWAIGDCTGRVQLAHAAYRMGEIAAANILDPQAYRHGEVMRWNTVPWCVYTLPEVAGVGLTQDAATAEGRDVLIGKVPALMSGRFIAENGFRAPGFAKVIVDAATHRVLGIHMLGAYASEMIWGAQALLECELTLEDARQLVFPHPTVSEVIREAIWAVPA
ncbi:MAG: dihydrolipoyl dehydrogenase [Actinobacteria bacterium]|nr:MAG: dihydrolipoyl dehydrogenase [Actinomycetota bacterium]